MFCKLIKDFQKLFIFSIFLSYSLWSSSDRTFVSKVRQSCYYARLPQSNQYFIASLRNYGSLQPVCMTIRNLKGQFYQEKLERMLRYKEIDHALYRRLYAYEVFLKKRKQTFVKKREPLKPEPPTLFLNSKRFQRYRCSLTTNS